MTPAEAARIDQALHDTQLLLQLQAAQPQAPPTAAPATSPATTTPYTPARFPPPGAATNPPVVRVTVGSNPNATPSPTDAAATAMEVAADRPFSPFGGAFPLSQQEQQQQAATAAAPPGAASALLAPQQQQTQQAPQAPMEVGVEERPAAGAESIEAVAPETVRALGIVLGPNQGKDSLLARVQRAVSTGVGRIVVRLGVGSAGWCVRWTCPQTTTTNTPPCTHLTLIPTPIPPQATPADRAHLAQARALIAAGALDLISSGGKRGKKRKSITAALGLTSVAAAAAAPMAGVTPPIVAPPPPSVLPTIPAAPIVAPPPPPPQPTGGGTTAAAAHSLQLTREGVGAIQAMAAKEAEAMGGCREGPMGQLCRLVCGGGVVYVWIVLCMYG